MCVSNMWELARKRKKKHEKKQSYLGWMYVYTIEREGEERERTAEFQLGFEAQLCQWDPEA